MYISQSSISSSTFFLRPAGHGRPLVLRSAEVAAWICKVRNKQLAWQNHKLKTEIRIRHIVTNLGISHDSMTLAIRVERKNVVRHVYLRFLFHLSVRCQNLRVDVTEDHNPSVTKQKYSYQKKINTKKYYFHLFRNSFCLVDSSQNLKQNLSSLIRPRQPSAELKTRMRYQINHSIGKQPF